MQAMKSEVLNLVGGKKLHQIHLDFWTIFYNFVIWIVQRILQTSRALGTNESFKLSFISEFKLVSEVEVHGELKKNRDTSI